MIRYFLLGLIVLYAMHLLTGCSSFDGELVKFKEYDYSNQDRDTWVVLLESDCEKLILDGSNVDDTSLYLVSFVDTISLIGCSNITTIEPLIGSSVKSILCDSVFVPEELKGITKIEG